MPGELSNLQKEVERLTKTVENFGVYTEKSANRHTEIMTSLAVIQSKQSDMAAYQLECDAQRADHATRLTQLETSQRTAIRIFGSGAFISIILAVIQMFKR